MNVRQLKGKPVYTKKKFSGYMLWKQSNGFHLRWMTKKGKKHSFQGTLTYQGKVLITKKENIQIEDKLAKAEKKTIKWDVKGQDQLVGFNFLTPKSFTLELQIDNKNVKSKEIYLGPEMENPEENPFLIDIPYKETVPKAVLEHEPKPTPISQAELEQVSQPEPEPVYQTKPKPFSQPEPEPVYQPKPKPVSQPEPGPVYELEGEFFSPDQRINNWLTQLKDHRMVFKPEPAYEPEPEPAYQPEPEPVYEAEPVYAHEPLNEPEVEPESVIESLPAYKDLPISKSSSEELEEEILEKRIYNWLRQLNNHRKGL
ncbi:MAG: hypothetical protein ACFFD1_08145 [Candidatus Thorarchaeota archaeon]